VAERHPGIELRLATAYSGSLQQWLDHGDLDMSLLYNLTTTQSVRVLPLLRDKLWAVAPPTADLRIDEPVDIATVFGHPFVMPVAGEHGLRLLIDEAQLSCDVELQVVVQANSMSLQIELVTSGHGWTILPASGLADHLGAGRLSAAPLCRPELERSVGLALPRTGTTTPAVQAVATELVRVVRSAVTQGRWSSATLVESSDEDPVSTRRR
jgi:LysR family nitrogen assimilation transcriptional regulator